MDTKILSTVPPTITVFLNKVQSLKKGGVKFKSDAFHSPIVRLIAKTRVPRTHEKTDEDRDRDRDGDRDREREREGERSRRKADGKWNVDSRDGSLR